MKFVMGDINQLKSRTLYTAIDSKEAPISSKQFPGVRSELEFWLGNATLLNKRCISEYISTYVNVYSDASDTRIGTRDVRSHRNLEPNEKELSSTWRELTAISSGHQSVEGFLSGKSINWFTNNYAASLIVSKGSCKITYRTSLLRFSSLC